jgi:hypothetical protein
MIIGWVIRETENGINQQLIPPNAWPNGQCLSRQNVPNAARMAAAFRQPVKTNYAVDLANGLFRSFRRLVRPDSPLQI